MAVGETPGQGRKSGSKSLLEFLQAKTIKCLRFVSFPIAENSHFIMCHVTKYSTICGVFQQSWQGVFPTAILNEEKALGTRLGAVCVREKEFSFNFNLTPAVLTQNAKGLI